MKQCYYSLNHILATIVISLLCESNFLTFRPSNLDSTTKQQPTNLSKTNRSTSEHSTSTVSSVIQYTVIFQNNTEFSASLTFQYIDFYVCSHNNLLQHLYKVIEVKRQFFAVYLQTNFVDLMQPMIWFTRPLLIQRSPFHLHVLDQ